MEHPPLETLQKPSPPLNLLKKLVSLAPLDPLNTLPVGPGAGPAERIFQLVGRANAAASRLVCG